MTDPCLYYLTNQVILFCEEAESKRIDDATGPMVYEMSAARTLVIQPVQQGRQIELSMNRMNEGSFKPGTIIVPATSVVMIQSCGDQALLTKMRAALSGLVVAR